MSDKPITTKLCNFLIDSAVADLSLADSLTYFIDAYCYDWAVEAVLEKYCQAYGGLWVGGAVTLSQAHITFSPNLINMICHNGDDSLAIPLSHIIDVSLESGFLTKIILLTTPYGLFRLRCFGAKSFMAAINQQLNENLYG
ncbi:hypothetical protein [Pseudoalteromonas sp. OOF1S-7]|uniref:hypothetical protein n=1 Tax=Pseudoalteromonas sp. OOF1S-7 TaxID=2917757 RepID=UPI001EF63CB2|nr:hypothetical protein [Pseudoalteromonas sp. OOF1S-7]MCG7537035.1 hypothetical protein [Pseudoalteromonas sp. OOF1S-7]